MAQTALALNINFPIYNSNGTPFNNLVLHKAVYESIVMSLGDKISGDINYKDNTLAVTMHEYIEYKGVKYVLVDPPSVQREGKVSDNKDLCGTTKYSFVFYHPMYMLGNFPFTDIAVTEDEAKYLSQNKTFPWVGNLFEFIDKTNANLRSTEWVVDHNITQYEQDGVTPTSQWQKAMKISKVLTFDKQFVADALKVSFDEWGIPFTITSIKVGEEHYSEGKRFLIQFGLPTQEIYGDNDQVFVFQFGKGVGLSNNSRTSKNNKIITRIAGYGTERNIPYGYPQIPWEGEWDWEFTAYENNSLYQTITYEDLYRHIVLEYVKAVPVAATFRNELSAWLTQNVLPATRGQQKPDVQTQTYSYGAHISGGGVVEAFFVAAGINLSYSVTNVTELNEPSEGALPLYMGIYGGQYVKLIKHPFTRTTLMPTVYVKTVNRKVNPFATQYDPDTEIVDYYDATVEGNYPNPINPLAPSFEMHQFEDIYPRLGDAELAGVRSYDGIAEMLTVSEYENRIQLFISRSSNEKEKACLQETFNLLGVSPLYYEQGGSYTCKYEEIRSVVYDYGIWYHIKYTSMSTNFEYYVYDGSVAPTLEVDWDDTVDEDGNVTQSYFIIQLPILSFDLYACASITENMKVNMRGGSCIGCTFDIYVDWDDYKKNFYDSEGNFAPNGSQRDLNKYPNSMNEKIDVIVKKDIETFGTILPNSYRQPAEGDLFVILGISLPQSYITAAQQELDSAAKEYMLENNVYYYEYPLKFDSHFLATNVSILNQIKNNNVVRFMYAGSEMALYIKQITVKYGEDMLPQYDITLTDDVEIVLNSIGKVTDDVSRMRVELSELQKYYSENIFSLIAEKLSKVVDDVCQGHITFQNGLDSIGAIITKNDIKSEEFESGLYTGNGWKIDKLGNAEFESATVRSYLKVVELLINRLQAQEGDTMFTDNDQIDKVDRVVNPSTGNVSYILSLKEKYEGYITSQMYGNVIRGIINTLAAKQAGLSDYEGETVEVDGSNSYYTSWMRCINTHNTDNNLGVNQIEVVLYSDDYTDPSTGIEYHFTPAGKNFEPCELMTIARWGCIDYSDPSDPDYEEIKASIERRQRMFMISNTDGRVVKYTGVNSPLLDNHNYGVSIGELPDFVKNYTDVARVLAEVGEHTDWLYAQGIVVGNFIKVDIQGHPEINYVDCGEWVDGASVLNPTPRNGVYLHEEWNETAQQYETDDVWHNNAKWRCLQHQPVVVGGVTTYYEPTEANSAYWLKLTESHDAASVYATPSQITIPCDNDGSVTAAVSQQVTLSMKVGNKAATVRSQSAGTLPSGVTVTNLYSGIIRIDVSTSAVASALTAGVPITVTGVCNGIEYSAPVTIALICSKKGDEGEDAPVAFATPDKISVPCGSSGNVLASLTQGVSFSLKVGSHTAAVTNVTSGTKPTGVTVQGQVTGVVTITIGTTATATGLAAGVTFTVTGTYGGKTYSASTTVALIGASKGSTGDRGKTGKFYYFANVWDGSNTTDLYSATDTQAPYFKVGSSYFVYVGEYDFENKSMAWIEGHLGTPSSSNEYFSIMTDDFKYLITEAIFGTYAHFGASIINGDFLMSQYGFMRGYDGNNVAINDDTQYQNVDPDDMFGEEPMESKTELQLVNDNTEYDVTQSTYVTSSQVGLFSFSVVKDRYYAVRICGYCDSGESLLYKIATSSGASAVASGSITQYKDTETFFPSYILFKATANSTLKLWARKSSSSAIAAIKGIDICESVFVPNLCIDMLQGKLVANNIIARGELHSESLWYDVTMTSANADTITVKDESIITLKSSSIGTRVLLPSPSSATHRVIEIFSGVEERSYWQLSFVGATSADFFRCPCTNNPEYRRADYQNWSESYVKLWSDGTYWYVLKGENTVYDSGMYITFLTTKDR